MKAGSWGAIALILLYAALIAASHGKSLALVNDVAQAFSVSFAAAGWVVSAVAAVAAVAAPLVGWSVDRLGERRAIAIGLAIAIAAGYSVSLAPDFRTLILFRVIEGAGYIAVVLGALSLLIRTTSGPRQHDALAIWPAASPIGGAIAVILVSHIVGTGTWRIVFQIHAALLVVALLATPLLPASPTRQGPHTSLSDVLRIYRHAAILRLGASLGGLYVLDLGLAAASQSYLAHGRGIAPTVLGEMFAASVALMVLAAVATGQLLKRGVPGVFIGAIGALVAISGTITTFAPDVPVHVAIVASVLSGVGGGILMSWLTTTIPAAAPDPGQIGSTGGILSQLLYLGMFLGPPVVLWIFNGFPRIVFDAVVAAANLLPVLLHGFAPAWAVVTGRGGTVLPPPTVATAEQESA